MIALNFVYMGTTLSVLGLASVIGLSACCSANKTSKPLEVVKRVDIDRYLGTWYEIARYPNRFQKDCLQSTADYRLRDDGDIAVINLCRKRDVDGPMKSVKGKAWIVDTQTNAKLKVRFFWPFSGDYWIIELGKNYEYAVVGEPSRKYLWILSRKPTMPEDVFRDIQQRLQAKAYDPARLLVEPGSLVLKD